MHNYLGEIAALFTAVFWTITSLAFESAGKKVGSLPVNLIRLVIAFILLGVYSWIVRGVFIPVDATLYQWKWLILSGIVGFVIGDLLLFQAYVVIGARISMLVMSLAPPFAAFVGWLVLGEILTLKNWIGMTITLTGIIIVILKRERTGLNSSVIRQLKSGYSLQGVLLALGGAIGQAAGLVLSKKGMGSYDAFSATQIRVIAGIAGFTILFFYLKRWSRIGMAIINLPAMKRITLGAVFGPFLGVAFSLLAVQRTETGVAATLMAIVPVLIIAPAHFIFHEKINAKEIIGAIVTVLGIAFFFW